MSKRATTDREKAAVIHELLQIWLDNPNLRLAQLIGNVYPCGVVPEELGVLPHHDPYHVEDFNFVEEIKEFYKEKVQ